ncbi:MAG: hypothetical protein JST75_02835 [Bacteroidetes bacterium]|nr:hypothetical protein [Bacteroidota bacterium]
MKKRWERKISFLVAFFFLLGMLKTQAQKPVFRDHGMVPEKFECQGSGQLIYARSADFKNGTTTEKINLISTPINRVSLRSTIPPDYYVHTLGFFCKREWEFEKKVHVPLRIRLGSLEYCNYLEGKSGSYVQ